MGVGHVAVLSEKPARKKKKAPIGFQVPKTKPKRKPKPKAKPSGR